MMKYAEAVDLYKKYYDEYMNDPARVKQRKTYGRYAQFIPMLGLGGVGAGAGATLGGILGLSRPMYQMTERIGGDTGLGALAGGLGGGLLGLIMGMHLKRKAREDLEIRHRDEAWRYAAMMSGKADPGNTLV